MPSEVSVKDSLIIYSRDDYVLEVVFAIATLILVYFIIFQAFFVS
jgi:hypothetical protein